MGQPIRMCIVCRTRIEQKALRRFQQLKGELVLFSGNGRSFYLCETCMKENEKKVIKVLNHKCKTHHQALTEFGKIFKETGSNG